MLNQIPPHHELYRIENEIPQFILIQIPTTITYRSTLNIHSFMHVDRDTRTETSITQTTTEEPTQHTIRVESFDEMSPLNFCHYFLVLLPSYNKCKMVFV